MATLDPGATPTTSRVPAPDLARGAMLLLIALANVHIWGWGHPLGPRGYPADIQGADQVVALLQTALVDGRAYPLFGLLFGYGIVQLTRRRAEVGLPVEAVVALVRRRGWWMLAIGLVHGVLLWSGDIVGAYGLIAVVLAGLLVRGSDRALLRTTVVGALLISLVYAGAAFPLPGQESLLISMGIADPLIALAVRAAEWVGVGVLSQALGVFGAVALGAWAARRRILDDPAQHRALLRRAAVVGIPVAVLSGLPLGLQTAGLWAPGILPTALSGSLHTLGGYAGGIGYAALFGLLALRGSRPSALRGSGGAFRSALQACGRRSLSCYVAQSVAFAALFPAWTLGLGEDARLWQLALAAVGTWLVVLVIAAASDRAGIRGPLEVLLRRLTYGRDRAPARDPGAGLPSSG